MLEPLDVITEETRSFWRSPIYREFRRHQRKRGYRDNRDTHSLTCIDRRTLFEATSPVARFRSAESLLLNPKKRWRQWRYRGEVGDTTHLWELAEKWEGTPYDWWELVDFKIADLLKFQRVYQIFGTPKEKVCSPMTSTLTNAFGIPYAVPLNSVPPAYWSNSDDWELWDYSKHYNRRYG